MEKTLRGFWVSFFVSRFRPPPPPASPPLPGKLARASRAGRWACRGGMRGSGPPPCPSCPLAPSPREPRSPACPPPPASPAPSREPQRKYPGRGAGPVEGGARLCSSSLLPLLTGSLPRRTPLPGVSSRFQHPPPFPGNPSESAQGGAGGQKCKFLLNFRRAG